MATAPDEPRGGPAPFGPKGERGRQRREADREQGGARDVEALRNEGLPLPQHARRGDHDDRADRDVDVENGAPTEGMGQDPPIVGPALTPRATRTMFVPRARPRSAGGNARVISAPFVAKIPAAPNP